MTVSELLRITDAELTNISDPFLSVEGATSRSDEVKNGSAFICIKGGRHDGREYCRCALERGASVIVADDDIPDVGNTPFIKVRDSRKALAKLCAAFSGDPQKKLVMIGVTGTNGKTTVVRLIKNILSCSGEKAEEIGTLTGSLTTPDCEDLYPLLRGALEAGCRYAVMEVSSHSLALGKVSPIRYTASVFTNLTRDHLDFHRGMESYAECKSALFSQSLISVINRDSPYGGLMAGRAAGMVRYFSAVKEADFTAREAVYGKNETKYKLCHGSEVYGITTPLAGDFNVYNTLAAASLSLSLGIDISAVQNGIAQTKTVPGRMERIETGCGIDVYIDFAHTPDALKNALTSLRRVTEGKITVVFGCGGDRDREKRGIMGDIAARYADKVIITGDNDRSEKRSDIISDIVSGIKDRKNYGIICDRKAAIEHAVTSAEEGDVILLAGKGHERYMITGGKTLEFNEREIAEEAVKKRNKGK